MSIRYSERIEQIADRLSRIDVTELVLTEVIDECRRSMVEVINVLCDRATELECDWDRLGLAIRPYLATGPTRRNVDAVETYFELANAVSPAADRIDTSKPLVIKPMLNATKAAKELASIRRREEYRDLEVRRMRHVCAVVLDLEVNPWEVMPLEDFKLNRANVGKHASDPAKPWIMSFGRGKYAVRQAEVGQYRRGSKPLP